MDMGASNNNCVEKPLCCCKSEYCVIIGAAPGMPAQSTVDLCKSGKAFLICADGGINKAIAAGLKPDLHVTDSDSGGDKTPADVERIALKKEKDDTDTAVAVNYGLARGAIRFVLDCCAGGRPDHYLTNIALLEYLSDRGAKGVLIAEKSEIRLLLPGQTMSIGRDPRFKYLSVLPVDEHAEGVYESGVKYPLENAVLLRGRSLGVSNEITADTAAVSVGRGKTLVILSSD